MNTLECIADLARQNGKRAGPKRLEDVVGKGIPYISIERSGGRWVCTGHGHTGHDNEQRMDLYVAYMNHAILPNIREVDIGGYYNIELHDSYTYLGRERGMYRDCLVFSRFKDDTGPVAIPDPYMVGNWGGGLAEIEDNLPWEEKKDVVCFYGTTTGNRDPRQNRRIQMCLWATGRDSYDFKINNIAQMTPADILGAGVDLGKIYTAHRVGVAEQMKNRFMFLPDGNTCKFDVWNWKTGVLGLKDESKDVMWYGPMMRDGEHFVEVNEKTMENERLYYNANPTEAKRITCNANRLADEIFKPMAHMYYTTTLFQEMALNRP